MRYDPRLGKQTISLGVGTDFFINTMLWDICLEELPLSEMKKFKTSTTWSHEAACIHMVLLIN